MTVGEGSVQYRNRTYPVPSDRKIPRTTSREVARSSCESASWSCEAVSTSREATRKDSEMGLRWLSQSYTENQKKHRFLAAAIFLFGKIITT